MKAILQFLLFLLMMLLTETILRAAPPMHVNAVRRSQAIVIDGMLSEPIWKDQNAVSAFIQREPKEGVPATEKTFVDVIFDNDALYVGARMYDSDPKGIIALLGRKDVQLTSDSFTFYVDPYYDRRTGFYFSVNAAGTQYDGTLYNDSWNDNSWDGVWEGKAHIDASGWTVEMRIPYSQLRFQRKNKYVWGVNCKRFIARKNESDFLVYQPKNGSGFVSRFPDLVGVENIVPPRRLEFMPYVTGKAAYTGSSRSNPFNDGSKFNQGFGADVRLGLGTNFTVNGTMNPDFGQVEVDPAVVNLSDVETFFNEKRPFFIEGSSIFDFGHGGVSNYWGFNWSDPLLFYSRRIGRTPQGSVPDSDYSDVPAGTQIIGAAKITGKLWNDFSVGSLHAFTDREIARIDQGGEISELDVEPYTYYNVSRVLKEFNEGKQGFGFLSTLTKRSFNSGSLRDELNSSSFAAAFDGWTFLGPSKTWALGGWLGFSNLKGTKERITDVQEDSRHYFQRPDADHFRLDPQATSLSGVAGRINLNKEKGNFFINSALGVISPGFDINDVGFLWRADQINGHAGGGYKWTTPGKYTREANIRAAAFQTNDFDGNTTWKGYFLATYAQFLNYYTIDAFVAYNPETISTTRTRGGPLTINPSGTETWFMVNSDSRKKWVFSLGGDFNDYRLGSLLARDYNGSVEWKPASNLSVSLAPEYYTEQRAAQYVDTVDDPLATATFGKRYVFAELHQKTFSAGVRLNWTFSPKLSLQFYGQPLVSAGDYSDFKELARPSSYDFLIYGTNGSTITPDLIADPDGSGAAGPIQIDNPDFNFKSLRGNAVLRWEYKPGSTLYFVWTQTRTSEDDFGDFRFNHSLNRLFTIKPDNIFLVKFSYYWNM